MGRKYGYVRVSTPHQNVDRQIRNIKEYCPEAIMVVESYTGRTFDRPEWNKLKNVLKAEDVVIFDEVSRMGRDADEGFSIYKDLYYKDISLVFLKEHHIDTESYKKALKGIINVSFSSGDNAVDTLVTNIMDAVNVFMMNKVEMDIYNAFAEAQREVDILSQRTKEGIETARINGKQIGAKPGIKLTTKKSVNAKDLILKHSKDFGGTLTDSEVIRLAGISRNSFYKYKKELRFQKEVH